MIERRVLPSGRVSWCARYRDPDGRERSKSFPQRRLAEEFERRVREQVREGDWFNPQRGAVRLVEVWEEYERTTAQHLRATTRQNYRAAWKNIGPALGDWPVAKIGRGEVVIWIEELRARKGTETVRAAHRVLCLVLDHAANDRRIRHNPARGVPLPRRAPARDRILNVSEVESLAARLGTEGDLVLTMAFLGLRWSELAALRVADVDLAARRVRVVERATEVAGRIDVSAPKSPASRRRVAIPQALMEILERRTIDKGRPDLVFPAPTGGYLRNGNWKRAVRWATVTTDLGLAGITPHDLRRTFGSMARAAGADLRWIQRAMGHESITTTAKIYAHLYDDELDLVANAMDDLRTRGGVR